MLLQYNKQLECRLESILKTKSVIPAPLLHSEKWRQENPLEGWGPNSLQYAAQQQKSKDRDPASRQVEGKT